MMDSTDRRCRAFHRLMTRRARLYTEMVTADAVVFGRRERLIGFDAEQHPITLQLGGSEPGRLAEAARIGADFGDDEINLNCGCPSDRGQSGRFGACLMREPARSRNASPRWSRRSTSRSASSAASASTSRSRARLSTPPPRL